MVVSAKPVTVEELWGLRHGPYRLALIDGGLYRLPGAGGIHGEVTGELSLCLTPFVRSRGLGKIFVETGFRLFPDRLTTLFPDVAFVRTSRVPSLAERQRFLNLFPDLAIEIYSPTDYPKLLREKLSAYFEAGTSLVWVLYPRNQSITVYRSLDEHVTLGADDLLEGGEVLPGCSIRVGDLFQYVA